MGGVSLSEEFHYILPQQLEIKRLKPDLFENLFFEDAGSGNPKAGLTGQLKSRPVDCASIFFQQGSTVFWRAGDQHWGVFLIGLVLLLTAPLFIRPLFQHGHPADLGQQQRDKNRRNQGGPSPPAQDG